MQQTFTNQATWTMSHPWGSVHPYVVATKIGGVEIWPDVTHTIGQVQATFDRPESGTLELLNPESGGGDTQMIDDLVGDAVISLPEGAVVQ